MDDTQMQVDVPVHDSIAKATQTRSKTHKSHDIYSTTIRTPLYAYAQLELMTTGAASAAISMDELQMRSYLSSAMKQFLGATGSGIPIDILKVSGRECWVRVPRLDLGAFAAAITAWVGSGASISGFQIRAAGDWLGALVGRHDQRKLWGES